MGTDSGNMTKLIGKYKSNEIIVNTKSNFKSHLVKCQSIMDNSQYDELVLKGLGKATTRALNLALQLNLNNYKTFDLIPTTYSVEIYDESKSMKRIKGTDRDQFDPDDIDITKRKVTFVPAIEIVVRKSKIELENLQQKRKRSGDHGLKGS